MINYNIISIFLLISYFLVTLFLATKYEAGFFIKNQYKKSLPKQFLEIITTSLILIIFIIGILAFFFSFKGHGMFCGIIMGLMLYNITNMKIK